jgi:hypothetical protein
LPRAAGWAMVSFSSSLLWCCSICLPHSFTLFIDVLVSLSFLLALHSYTRRYMLLAMYMNPLGYLCSQPEIPLFFPSSIDSLYFHPFADNFFSQCSESSKITNQYNMECLGPASNACSLAILVCPLFPCSISFLHK